ncbi:MAG: dTDP-glucose 4,6-dehydratase [Candidatus Geothermincolia bacterium]
MSDPTWIVTGGSGFIGSAFARLARARDWARIVNLDALTYAGNPENLAGLAGDPGYAFVRGDICDAALVARLLAEHRPAALVNFAAETHVDRSIFDAAPFLRTNVLGTQNLLDAARGYFQELDATGRAAFRFLHVSTDEVYGTLGPDDPPFRETTAYAPNSPYAASKAAADHLVRAARHTHGLPTLVTNCSNNYGPRQFPEKLIPLIVCNAREGRPLPVYGDGMQVRDWLHVDDHCEALARVIAAGRPGETYNVGGGNERTNLHVVRTICRVLDELEPAGAPRERLIAFVTDRPGHDRRYAIDAAKIRDQIGWSPRIGFEAGIRDTVRWYLDNPGWVERVRSGAYREWLDVNYANRKEVAS